MWINYGGLKKSAIERIRSQDGADAGMSLNCRVPLEIEFFEVPYGSLLRLTEGLRTAITSQTKPD
jgi:hypothetical protein